MSNYLKMDDGFYDLDVGYLEQRIFSGLVSKEECTYAAHAINSHDELVQQRNELLAALNDAATSLETIQLRSFGEDSFLDSKPEMRSYAGSRASIARGAIAKAKGGEA